MTALLTLLLLAAPAGPITWLHDDYGKALATAKAANKPLVVDLWAPWCHTCLSMKQTVLANPAMKPFAERFVWLAIDTDRPENAKALTTLQPGAWPTFYVIDPVTEAVTARHVGAATLAEFHAFLGAASADGPADAKARAGDAAAAAGDFAAAETFYSAALAAAPADWVRKVSVLVAHIGALYKQQKYADCARFGLARLAGVGANRSAGAADFSWYAHYCAQQSGDKALEAQVRAAVMAPEAPLRQLLADPANLSTDDHSDALRILRELEDAAGNTIAAKALAQKQLRLLQAAWKSAPDAEARMTLGWPIAEVAVYLERGAEVLSDLRALTRALPRAYDPPYRLAWVLLKLKRYDQAWDAANQALVNVYGPRKGRVFGLLAQIHAGRGDVESERKARVKAVELYERLPAGQRNPKALQAAREALAKLE